MFASTLGYNSSAAFVTGLVVCDGDYIPVAKTSAINVIDPDALEANVTAAETLGGSNSTSGGTSSVGRALADATSLDPRLNDLNISVHGQVILVELGVAIPTLLGPAMSRFLTAMLNGASAEEIAAAAANLTALMNSTSYAALETSSAPAAQSLPLPSALVSIIGTARRGGNTSHVAALMGSVVTSSADVIRRAFNMSDNETIVSAVLPPMLGPPFGGNIAVTGNVGTPSEQPLPPGLPYLGLLALLPLLCCVGLCLCRRRRKEKEEEEEGMKSLEHANHAAVDASSSSAAADTAIPIVLVPDQRQQQQRGRDAVIISSVQSSTAAGAAGGGDEEAAAGGGDFGMSNPMVAMRMAAPKGKAAGTDGRKELVSLPPTSVLA